MRPHYFWGRFIFGGLVMNKPNIKKLSGAAMLCAVAYLCVFIFRFKVGFLTFDFKDSILAVIGFVYGPIYAVISSLVVALIEMFSVSDTGPYGFIMNFLASAVFSGVCGLFYRSNKTLKGAVLGAVSATALMTAVMMLANIFITPYYMGTTKAEVIALIPTMLLPFNLVKGAINAAVTMIIYKPIVAALKRAKLIIAEQSSGRKRVYLPSVIALVVIILCVLFILFYLKGSFALFS